MIRILINLPYINKKVEKQTSNKNSTQQKHKKRKNRKGKEEMGSESTPNLKLPVIDFFVPDLKPGTTEWDSLKLDVRNLKSTGVSGQCSTNSLENLKMELYVH